MQSPKSVFKASHTQEWTLERIERLGNDELRSLRANAERLGVAAVMALCDEAIGRRPVRGGKRGPAALVPKHLRRLISRSKAFEARGIAVAGMRGNWSGIRDSDGMVVMSLWASAVISTEGVLAQLLWAPNTEGERPWSDTPAGKLRLAHCQLALERGTAEGLMVYGETPEGALPEESRGAVYGVDPTLVVRFQVERRGEQYWAVWGRKAPERPL